MNINQAATANEGTKESRGPRLRKSCEACRYAKAKCGPSKGDARKCEKCFKENRQCLFLEAKPRVKQAKTSRTRVAEMEEKVETLLALLTSNRAEKVAPISNTPLSGFTETAEPFAAPVTYSISHVETSKIVQSPIISFPAYENFDDVISRGVVEFSQAEECLRLYRLKCANFPFVNIPLRMTVDVLRRQRPFLLLSILAFGTDLNAKLQEQLNAELKETLARRVMVNGEKSLDLLQGVLVYLGWYHFHFDPMMQQIYQIAQMVAAMACDLGLNKNTLNLPSNSLGLLNASFPTLLSSDELERRRTFLGCYYLTSWVSLGLRKPGSLKYSNYMEECVQSLAQAREEKTDRLLSYFIQFQHLAEEVNQTFDYESTFELSQSDSFRIGFLLKGFEQRLDDFQASCPPEIWNNVALALSFYSLRIYVNEVCFNSSPPTIEDPMPLKVESWHFSSARNECFIRCLKASKTFLDYALSLTPKAYLDFTLPDFGRLVYAVLILGAFADKCDAPMLDTEQIKQCADCEYYLNGFVEKTAQVVAQFRPDGSNAYMSYTNGLFARIRMYYLHSTNGNVEKVSYITRPDFSFLDILTVVKECCLEIEASSATMSEASSGDQWADMLNDWPSNPLEQSQLSMNEPRI